MIQSSNKSVKSHIRRPGDNMQQNSKCRLCGDRDKTINHIRKCSKLAKKSIRLDMTG